MFVLAPERPCRRHHLGERGLGLESAARFQSTGWIGPQTGRRNDLGGFFQPPCHFRFGWCVRAMDVVDTGAAADAARTFVADFIDTVKRDSFARLPGTRASLESGR